MQAAATLRPATTTELVAILRRDSRPLEPIGLGTKRGIGRPIDAEPLELSALSGIIDYRPEELVLSVQAATPLSEIERMLADHDQRLAFEPPDLAPLLGNEKSNNPMSGTIGGVLAANLSGSRRVAAGAARDHFLGVTAVDGRGELFRAGGRVVKNVTGYDVPKLLAGSWGDLAIMTEVTLKVVPRAETESTLIIPDDEPAAAVGTLSAALGSAHEVTSAAFDPWRGSAVRLEGFAASVEARRAALLAELGRPDAQIIEAAESTAWWRRIAGADALADWPVVWRLSVPPSDAPRVVAAIDPERYVMDWGGGLIWAAFRSVDAAAVRGALREGHAMLIKAPDDAKPCRRHPPTAAVRDVLDRLKRAFDPDGRLNPGRMD